MEPAEKPRYTYTVIEEIGRGAFGVVHKVRRSDGLTLCRKRTDSRGLRREHLKQLMAEFEVLHSLRHPNIVTVYAFEPGLRYFDIYMEFCNGGDLRQEIDSLRIQNKPTNESFVWQILSQLLSALYFCHYRTHPPDVTADFSYSTPQPSSPKRKGFPILHRDIKPENIFLDDGKNVKLGDFGLCKQMAGGEFATSFIGTELYMAPEIHRSERYTFSSDIWAVGCTIYELCRWEPPFRPVRYGDRQGLVRNILHGKPTPLPSTYSPGLRYIVNSCLRVNPTERPSTVELVSLLSVGLGQSELKIKGLYQKMEVAIRQKLEVKARSVIIQHIQAESDRLNARYTEEVRREYDRLEALYKEEVRRESDRLNAQHWKDVEQRVAVELGNKLNERRPRPTKTGPVPLPKYGSCESSSSSEAETTATEVKIEGAHKGRRPTLKPKRRLPVRSNHS